MTLNSSVLSPAAEPRSRIIWVAALLFAAIVMLVQAFPILSERSLDSLDHAIRSYMPLWFVFIMGLVAAICTVCALYPAIGRLKLGGTNANPQYSLFAWFSMLFCTAVGVSIFTWAVAEPMHHLGNNPEVIKGIVEPGTASNLVYAYKWSYLHWGYSAWAIYAVCALAFGYQPRNAEQPARFPAMPVSGTGLTAENFLQTTMKVIVVLTGILSVAYTLGYGVQHLLFTFGQATNSAEPAIATATHGPSDSTRFACISMGIGILAVLSAGSGIGRGIKWLSVLSMVLGLVALGLFLAFGSTTFSLVMLYKCLIDYLVNLPQLLVTLFIADGTETGKQLVDWQEMWSVWHWAWWISFAPTVGFFLAKISRGRTIREFVAGAVVLPALLCFTWFTVLGGTAIDLELKGITEGVIQASADKHKIFTLLQVLFSPLANQLISMFVFVVMSLFLLTSIDSGLFSITGMGLKNYHLKSRNRTYLILTTLLVVSAVALNAADSMRHIRTAMMVSAFAFTPVLVLMSISFARAVYRDSKLSGNQT